MSKISDYQTSGYAAGLARIGAEPFTIVKVQDSSYNGKPSIRKITKKQKKEKKRSKKINQKKKEQRKKNTKELRLRIFNELDELRTKEDFLLALKKCSRKVVRLGKVFK